VGVGVGVAVGVGLTVGVGVGVAVGVWARAGSGEAAASASVATRAGGRRLRMPLHCTGGRAMIRRLMRLLVTGGAGYIGSVVAHQLLERGDEVTVLDSLARGHREAVPEGAAFTQVDLLDEPAVRAAVADGGFEGVLHFAALALVAESVEHPERYYRTNVLGTLNLLEAMRDAGVPRLVFSSTCATYGEPDAVPMDETVLEKPVNPYGNSKLAVDRLLDDFCAAHGLGAISLRYFNVAGASGPFGEDHEPETHLIPLILQAAAGKRDHIAVFGTDYATDDGTAVRDYIHVEDLGAAHLLALGKTRPGHHDVYNLGTGTGYSVRQMVDTARAVTGREIEAREEPRRPGDPPQLVAANRKAREGLGWIPERGIEDMIRDAWAWHQAHPDGYSGER
jgi:UDP-glucose 4-epimerase